MPFAKTLGTRRGFTLVELTIVVGVILLLLGILLTAFGAVRDSAKATQIRSAVTSTQFGVETFKTEFGFLPPLVRDNPLSDSNIVGPLDTDERFRAEQVVPGFYLDGTMMPTEYDYEVLTGERFNDEEHNFSVYALPYYVIGALPAVHDSLTSSDTGQVRALDGVDGPGFFPVERYGGWEISTNIDASDPNDTLRETLDIETFQPFVEVGDDGLDIKPTPGAPDDEFRPYRLELRDPNDVAIRYYQWADGEWVTGANARYVPYGELDRDDQNLDALNVPDIFGDPANDNLNNFWDGGDPDLSPAFFDTELRGAEYAVVSAGPNGVFGDEFLLSGTGTSAAIVAGTLPREEAIRVIAEALGLDRQKLEQQQGTFALRALQEAREDNVYQVGARR